MTKNESIKNLGPFLGMLLLAASIWILHHELRAYHLHNLIIAFKKIPAPQLLAAFFLTLFDFAILISAEIFSFTYVKKKLSGSRIALTSFIAYAFSNSAGFSGFSGASVRYRFYSAWNLSGVDIAKLIAFVNSSFAFGFLLLAGATFAVWPFDIPSILHLPFTSSRPLGFVFLIIVFGYLTWTHSFKKPFKVKDWEFELPALKLSLVQIFFAAFDFLVLGAIFYVLLPAGTNIPFTQFTAIFLLALFAGIISQVPGGLGVFETVILLTFPGMEKSALMGSLLAFRTIYYLLPFCLGAIMLGLHEVRHRKEQLKEMSDSFTNASSHFVPFFISLAVFISGMVLLFSGATPRSIERILWLKDLLPLPIMELSHFLGSLAGGCLLILAWGIQRRLNAAYPLTVILLVTGIFFSLMKGWDYEEAMILSLMLAMVLPTKRHFYRKTSLINEPFSYSWIFAIAIAISASVWLGFFAFKHVNYSHDLWWRFELHGDAPRFMRASVGAVVSMLLFALIRLMQPASAKLPLTTATELEKAARIVKQSSATVANLALLRDKHFIFSETENSFIMYGVQGRSWVAFGDPVGPDAEARELIWQFHERADIHGCSTVFYDVSKENLFRYLDLGLSPVKIGEEAHIPLSDFSLEGGKSKNLRTLINQFEKNECVFEIIQTEQVPSILPALKKISDSWLNQKNTREKGFSLGFFSEDYLRRFPIAVIRLRGEIVAFANLWLGAGNEELSIDLMRYDPEKAPSGTMDFLFVQVMLWGKTQQFRWFNMGMAPLSGLEDRTLAPLWNRLGAFLFRHGEHFYNFQGLRQYKEKFHPVWEPKYLVSQGGFALPRILTDIAGLIAGGLKGIIGK